MIKVVVILEQERGRGKEEGGWCSRGWQARQAGTEGWIKVITLPLSCKSESDSDSIKYGVRYIIIITCK